MLRAGGGAPGARAGASHTAVGRRARVLTCETVGKSEERRRTRVNGDQEDSGLRAGEGARRRERRGARPRERAQDRREESLVEHRRPVSRSPPPPGGRPLTPSGPPRSGAPRTGGAPSGAPRGGPGGGRGGGFPRSGPGGPPGGPPGGRGGYQGRGRPGPQGQRPRRKKRRRRNFEDLGPAEHPQLTPTDAPVPEGEIVVPRGITIQELSPKLNPTAAA